MPPEPGMFPDSTLMSREQISLDFQTWHHALWEPVCTLSMHKICQSNSSPWQLFPPPTVTLPERCLGCGSIWVPLEGTIQYTFLHSEIRRNSASGNMGRRDRRIDHPKPVLFLLCMGATESGNYHGESPGGLGSLGKQEALAVSGLSMGEKRGGHQGGGKGEHVGPQTSRLKL